MPRVEWPQRQRKTHQYALVAVAASVVVSALFTSWPGVKPLAALAAVNQLPDPSVAVDSNSMYLDITQSTAANYIDAPDNYIKIYIRPSFSGIAKIDIWNLLYDPCSAGDRQPDFLNSTLGSDPACPGPLTDADHQVWYDFFALDSTETVQTPLFSLNGQTGLTSDGQTIPVNRNDWSNGISINAAGLRVSNLTGYKSVIMKVRWEDQPAYVIRRTHSYLVRTENSSDLLGYVAAPADPSPGVHPIDGEYIEHYVGPLVDQNIDHTEVDFGTPCTINSDTPAMLRWYDADAAGATGGADGSQYAGDIPPSFDFVSTDTSGAQTTQTITNSTVPVNVGGNNDYRELPFMAHPGWKYQWIWHNQNTPTNPVGAANNIEMWVPFDSINYSLKCWQYQSSITSVGTTPAGGPDAAHPVVLNFANPANYTNMTYRVSVQNVLSTTGPAAFVDPTLPVGLAAWTPGGPTINWSPGGVPTTTAIEPGGIPPGGPITKPTWTFSYSLSPTTPDGSVICFGDQIRPSTALVPVAPNVGPQQCYQVSNQIRSPTAFGHGNDIQAGGGLCDGPDWPPHYLQGNPATNVSGDYGDYVVATSGPTDSFGSNGSASDNALQLGLNGNYNRVCRPDLFTYAMNHQTGIHVPPGTYDISTNPNFAGSVVFIDGDATIHTSGGGLNHKLTIVTGGTINIASPGITLGSSPGVRSAVPTLGIIADTAILIKPGATTVSALMFTDNTLDTCDTGNLSLCQNTLTVNGFLVACNLLLSRLGPTSTTGAQIGEDVTFDPDVYLNPPTYFDTTAADNHGLQGLGERVPFF